MYNKIKKYKLTIMLAVLLAIAMAIAWSNYPKGSFIIDTTPTVISDYEITTEDLASPDTYKYMFTIPSNLTINRDTLHINFKNVINDEYEVIIHVYDDKDELIGRSPVIYPHEDLADIQLTKKLPRGENMLRIVIAVYKPDLTNTADIELKVFKL